MPKMTAKQLQHRAAKIKVVLMDVDGVLTQGPLYHFVDTAGALVELKGIHAQDSIALAWLAESGIATGIISGRVSRGTEERMKMLKVSYIYQHRLDKSAVFAEILAKSGAAPEQVLYIGDDLPDIPVLTRAGIGVAVQDARPEVKAAADWVTQAEGGRAAVREVAEVVLRATGKWSAILKRYAPAR